MDEEDDVLVRYHDCVKNPKHPDVMKEAAEEAEIEAMKKQRKGKKRKGGSAAAPDPKYSRQEDYGGGYEGYGYDVKQEHGQHGYADASYQDQSMMAGGDPNASQMAAPPAQNIGDLNEVS